MIRLITRFTFILLIGFMSLILGCASKDAKFYVLNPIASSTAIKTPKTIKSIAIDDIILPSYLDQAQIVTYRSANEVKVDEFHRWASRLKNNIAQVIKQNLVLYTHAQVFLNDLDRPSSVTCTLKLTIVEFNTSAEGISRLDANWQISRDISSADDDNNRKILIRQHGATYHTPTDLCDYDAIVNAMNHNLNQLTVTLARELRHYC